VVILVLLTEEEFRKFKQNDPVIVEKVYHACKKNLFNYFVIKTRGNHELAKELLHTTFCSAMESSSKLKTMENLPAWLLRIAYRRFADHQRKSFRENKYMNIIKQQEKSAQRNSIENKGEETDQETRVLLLHMAIDTLNEDYQKIVRMKYFEEKKVDEIAGILGKSPKSVESVLFRARKNLKKRMFELAKRHDL